MDLQVFSTSRWKSTKDFNRMKLQNISRRQWLGRQEDPIRAPTERKAGKRSYLFHLKSRWQIATEEIELNKKTDRICGEQQTIRDILENTIYCMMECCGCEKLREVKRTRKYKTLLREAGGATKLHNSQNSLSKCHLIPNASEILFVHHPLSSSTVKTENSGKLTVSSF